MTNLKTTGHINDMPKPNVHDAILNAGLDSLHQKGFNATSVQDITSAAGVPKGSFYNHFDSKEALGVAVISAYAQKTSGHLAMLADTSIAPIPRLKQYFAGMIEWSVRDEFRFGCLLGNFSAELSDQSKIIRDEVRGVMDSWSNTVALVIDEALDGASLRNHLSSTELAAYIIDGWEGALLRSKVEGSRAPLDAFLKITFDRLLS